MKVAKIKKTKEENKSVNQENNLKLKNVFIAALIILLIFGIFYIITNVVVNNNSSDVENNFSIDAKKILVKNIFDQSDTNYYVLIYLNDDENLKEYSTYINNNDNFYKADLSDAMNKNFKSDESVIENDIEKLKLSDTILLYIENNEVSEYYDTYDKIIEKLKSL